MRRFYGAMDGASKFVLGDSMPRHIIMVNIIGGLRLGCPAMPQHRHAAKTNPSDGRRGLVAQSLLLISTASGLIVPSASI